jgi:hypothetical protein
VFVAAGPQKRTAAVPVASPDLSAGLATVNSNREA